MADLPGDCLPVFNPQIYSFQGAGGQIVSDPVICILQQVALDSRNVQAAKKVSFVLFL